MKDINNPLQNILRLLQAFNKDPVTEIEQCTIEQVLVKGMKEDDIKEAIQRAYTSRNVDKPWNYFCGICWRIIRRTSRGSVGESVGDFGKIPWS